MANCRYCGTPLPAFGFGRQEICTNCRRQLRPTHYGESSGSSALDALGPFKATYILIGINVIVYLAMTAAGDSPTSPTVTQLIHAGANFGPKTLGEHEFWRTITCSFLHIGIIHIALNMWCLWALGRLCERLLGSFATAAIYLLTGVGAALLSVAYDPFRVSAGASGPIFGITGALAVVLYKADLGLIESARKGLLGYILRFAGLNLVFGLMSHIDNMAHVGGLLTGAFIGAFLSRRPREMQGRPPYAAIVITGAILASLFVPLTRSKQYLLEMFTGEQALQNKQWDSAIEHLKQASTMHPADAGLHAALGYAYDHASQRESAIAEYQSALRINPQDINTEMNLADAYNKKGDFDQALPLAEQALQKRASDADVLELYGETLVGLKRYGEAERALRQSISIDGKDPDAHEALATVLFATGRASEAANEKAIAAKLKSKTT